MYLPGMTEQKNPLISDRDVSFVLYEVLDSEGLSKLPYFAEHSRETFDMAIDAWRRLAREVMYPLYKPMDEAPPVFTDGKVVTHPRMRELHAKLLELGFVAATRPTEVGGQQLPLTIATAATLYLMAANCSAAGFAGLTTGAAHLIEAFGSDALKRDYMTKMYAGEWTGTMALTEPHAGSSLADVRTRARPAADGTYRIDGSKIFISGGDQDLTPNIVHLTLARIEGAPAGIKGVSLFVVPKMRVEGGALVPNDVRVAGLIHKIGYRGLPSLAMSFGDNADCHGYLVGEPNRGINYMFQMMNEARIIVGGMGVATASVAYHEAVAYAKTRPQGRPVTSKDATQPQVPIVEHADVRRMLLRQKAIVEGAMSLVLTVSRLSDLGAHAADEGVRKNSTMLLDLLTPIAKTFPAERGFEANTLALQVHGGYGYSSEYLPESWLRDQKLNSIHEGTTGIQGMDLLGRKVVAGGGASLMALMGEIEGAAARARAAKVDASWVDAVTSSAAAIGELTAHLGGQGLHGDVDGMMRHSADYLEAFSIVVIAWQWLLHAAAAKEGIARTGASPFYEGKLCAAQYWMNTEVPRVPALVALCRSGEDSYARMKPDWF